MPTGPAPLPRRLRSPQRTITDSGWSPADGRVSGPIAAARNTVAAAVARARGLDYFSTVIASAGNRRGEAGTG